MQNDHTKRFEITIIYFNEGINFSKHVGQELYYIAFMIFFFVMIGLQNFKQWTKLNPKSAPSVFVIVNFAFTYFIKEYVLITFTYLEGYSARNEGKKRILQ